MSLRLLAPVPGATPTDRFGWRPAIPGVRPVELHDAQDYAAPAGTRIRAAHAGRCTYAGWDPTGGGWMVKISAARCTTLYLHMLERPPVATGDEIRAGQTIGKVGSTGNSTGPHCHFILRLNGVAVNPVPYIRKEPPMTEEEMQRLAKLVAKEVLAAPVNKLDGKPTSLAAFLKWSSWSLDTVVARLDKIIKKIGA